HPDLEGLRGDGLHVVDHGAPTRVAGEDSAADVRYRADPDAEDDEVEVGAHPERARARLPPLALRLELPFLAREPLAVDELRPVGRRGPARQAPDVDERP